MDRTRRTTLQHVSPPDHCALGSIAGRLHADCGMRRGRRHPPTTAAGTDAYDRGHQRQRRCRRNPLVLLPGHRRGSGPASDRGAGGRGLQRQPPQHQPEIRDHHLRRGPGHPGHPDRGRERTRHRRTGRRGRGGGLPRPVARPCSVDRRNRIRPQPSTTPARWTSTTPAARARSASRLRPTRRWSGTRRACSRRRG